MLHVLPHASTRHCETSFEGQSITKGRQLCLRACVYEELNATPQGMAPWHVQLPYLPETMLPLLICPKDFRSGLFMHRRPLLFIETTSERKF